MDSNTYKIRINMEPITLKQKFAFACVVCFVLYLCTIPFAFQNTRQFSSPSSFTDYGQYEEVLRIVKIR